MATVDAEMEIVTLGEDAITEVDNFGIIEEPEELEPAIAATPEEIAEAWSKIRIVEGDYGLKYFYTEDGKAICGAKNKRLMPCMKSPVQGRNRCRLHGGTSPRGIAHPRFKSGGFSRDVPSRLAQRYENAVADPKLLELRADIAVVEARIGDLLSRVDSGESGAMWRSIKTLYNDMRAAAQASDQQKFAALLNELGRVINKGQNDYVAWDEVLKTITSRRRLVESERKRLVEMKQMMTAEQAMGMLGFVVNVIKKRVYEIVPGEVGQKLLATISADISRYVASNKAQANDGSLDD